MTLAVLVFLLATLLLFLLPFLPGLREIRARRDAEALAVEDATIDVRHFAHGFRTFLERELGEAMARAARSGMGRSGWIEGQGQFTVLAGGEGLAPFDDEREHGAMDRVVAGIGDLEIPAGLRCTRELYAGGALRAGADVALRAALADGDMALDARVQVLRWAHAGRDLTAASDCVLMGRASADRSLTLAAGCRFERVNAPLIRFGTEGASPLPRAGDVADTAAPGGPLADWDPGSVAAAHELAAGRLLVEGDLEIPARVRVQCDLVVWGRLTLGAGARLEGSAKGHRLLTVGRGASVTGSVVGQGDVRIEDQATVDGPVIAEERLTIGARCVIGAPDALSTVRAGTIAVRAGSRVHGTVWSSGRGEVTA